MCVKSLLSNYPNVPALIVLCAERITVDAREKGYGGYDALLRGELQAQWTDLVRHTRQLSNAPTAAYSGGAATSWLASPFQASQFL